MSKYSFIETMRMLDKVLPSTTVRDYRTVSPEELWESIHSLVVDLGIEDKEKLEKLRREVMTNQASTHNRQTELLTINDDEQHPDYDQNNYRIKGRLEDIKTGVQKLIVEKNFRNDLITDIEYSDSTGLGTKEEVEEYASHDNIKRYVKDLLTATKERNDSIRFSSSAIVYDILTHFGIDADEYLDGALFDRVWDLIMVPIESSMIVEGRQDHEGSYESSHQNLGSYNVEVEKSIDQITSLVERAVNRAVENSMDTDYQEDEEEEREYTQTLDDYIKEQESRKVTNESEPSEKLTGVMSSSVSPNPETSEKSTVEELEQTVAGYRKLQDLMRRNMEIVGQISALEEKISELKKEFNENNEEIKEGMPHK